MSRSCGWPGRSRHCLVCITRSRCSTDNTYREEFLTEVTDEMGSTFRDRADYLALVDSPAAVTP